MYNVKQICIAFLFVHIYFIFLLYESEFQCFIFSTLCLKLFALYQFDNCKLLPKVRLTQMTLRSFAVSVLRSLFSVLVNKLDLLTVCRVGARKVSSRKRRQNVRLLQSMQTCGNIYRRSFVCKTKLTHLSPKRS